MTGASPHPEAAEGRITPYLAVWDQQSALILWISAAAAAVA